MGDKKKCVAQLVQLWAESSHVLHLEEQGVQIAFSLKKPSGQVSIQVFWNKNLLEGQDRQLDSVSVHVKQLPEQERQVSSN